MLDALYVSSGKSTNIRILSTLYCNALRATESIQNVIESYVTIWLPDIIFSDNSKGKWKAKNSKLSVMDLSNSLNCLLVCMHMRGLLECTNDGTFFTGWPPLDRDSVLFFQIPKFFNRYSIVVDKTFGPVQAVRPGGYQGGGWCWWIYWMGRLLSDHLSCQSGWPGLAQLADFIDSALGTGIFFDDSWIS